MSSRWFRSTSTFETLPIQRETRTEAPESLPLTAADLRTFARLDDYGEDEELLDAIEAATEFFERETLTCFLPQQWTITFERSFPPGGAMLGRGPFKGLVSVKTIRADADAPDEVWQAADYILKPGGVVKGLNSARLALGEDDWVELVYAAGHDDVEAFPRNMRQALCILAHEFYVFNRDVHGVDGVWPNMWPPRAWHLAQSFMRFRGL